MQAGRGSTVLTPLSYVAFIAFSTTSSKFARLVLQSLPFPLNRLELLLEHGIVVKVPVNLTLRDIVEKLVAKVSENTAESAIMLGL